MVKEETTNITPVSSYFEITKVVNFLERKILDLNLNISDVFVTWVGLRCSGLCEKDLEGYNCRTNQYLQDALCVGQLPDTNSIRNEKIEIRPYNILCSAIDKHTIEQKDETNFKDAVNHVAKITLNVLRQRGDVSGNDKYFSPSQKQKLSEGGYLIIPSVLSEDEIDKLSKLTLFIAQKEDDAGVSYRYGGIDNKLQRVYNLISKHPAYIDLLELPLVKEILEYYFAKDNLHHKYVLSSFLSNIVHPRGPSQQLHVDGWGSTDGQLPPSFTRLNVNFLLTDWTEDNGATLLVPGSHKLFRAPSTDEAAKAELLKVIAPKGSLVIWTGHTWHKSGENKSNKPRFGLFACFASSQLKEMTTEEEHLSVVDKEVMERLSPEFRFMIGMDRGIKKGAFHRVDFKDTRFDNLALQRKHNEAG